MAYDHEEQEQLATLKAWWQRNGNLTSWVLIVALAGYSGWAGWQYYQRTQAAQAGQLYDELQNAIAAKDTAKVMRAAGDMQSRFGGTAYAQMSALAAAKVAFDANDLKNGEDPAAMGGRARHGRVQGHRQAAPGRRLAGRESLR